MSVVRRETRRRWAVVAALLAALGAAPTLVATARTHLTTPAAPGATPAQLLARALDGEDVPHRAVAESRGALGLPDLGLKSVAGLLGGTTRTRVWWAGPAEWRVDTLSGTGETGDYAAPGALTTWDYETNSVTTTFGTPAVRLPRAVDLLPPGVARRFLRGLGPGDTVSALPDRLVAGAPAAGFRVRPGDDRSSLGSVDVWVQRDGLPVEVRVVGRTGLPMLTTRYLEVHRGRPPATLLRPPTPATAQWHSEQAPDVAARVAELPAGQLPGSLAGLPASTSLAAGAATYGRGLVRIVVLPLPPSPARRLLADAEDGGGVPVDVGDGDGEAVLLRSAGLAAVVAMSHDGVHAYLLSGAVTPDLLRGAAGDLLRSAAERWYP